MAEIISMWKCEANEKIVRIKTVGNFEKQRLELRDLLIIIVTVVFLRVILTSQFWQSDFFFTLVRSDEMK